MVIEVPRPAVSTWRCHMPWYWSDEVASLLVAHGTIEESAAAESIALPVAHRSEHETIEDAAKALLDDGEIPLAA